MQITLNQDEILNALDSYVRKQINIAPGHSIEIDMKAGRGDNGPTATLSIKVPDEASKPSSTGSNDQPLVFNSQATARDSQSKLAPDEIEPVHSVEEDPIPRSIFSGQKL